MCSVDKLRGQRAGGMFTMLPVPHEEERQPGVNSFAESAMFCKTICPIQIAAVSHPFY